MLRFLHCLILAVCTAALAHGQLAAFIASDGSVTAKGKWKLVSGQKEDEPPSKR